MQSAYWTKAWRRRVGGRLRHRFGGRRHIGVSDNGVGYCGRLGGVRAFGVGGEGWRAAVFDRHYAGPLDAGRTEGSKRGNDPNRENDRRAQRRAHCRKSPRVLDALASKGSA
jgi:hypothetical protein